MPQPDEIRPMSDRELAEQIAGTEPGGAAAEEAELCRRFARHVREGVPVRHDVVHPGETVACQATPDHFSTYKLAHSAAGDF
ncbi:MAG: hypothetical protein WCF10_15605 [Polyangiales bacterium]